MSRHLLAMLLVSVSLLSASANAAEGGTAQRESEDKQMERIKEDMKRRDIGIRFYGKVLDQDDRPVEGAEITLQITQFNPLIRGWLTSVKEIHVKTDLQGCFLVDNENGRSLYVKDVQREGYEFSLKQNPDRLYEYSGSSRSFASVKNNPAVFHVRRKRMTTFLLEQKYLEFQVPPAKSGLTIGYDFVRRHETREGDRPVYNPARFVNDLQLKATFNVTDAGWTVTLSSGTPTGGIIVSDQLLYEAPETGYQPDYTFTAEDRKPGKARYIYLRSREPVIYTRIEIEDIRAFERFFNLSGKSVTNPYGDRNLEQEADLPFEVEKQLTKDAKDAFSRNKRPAKPDLPKMIKEAAGKARKNIAKQEGAEGKP